MNENTPRHDDAFEQALSQRLARLSARPVDTSRLDRKLDAVWADPAPARPLWRRLRWPIQVAAAVVFLVLGGALFMMQGETAPQTAGQTQQAGSLSASLWQIYSQSAEAGPMQRVQSVDAAEQFLARRWREAPRLPRLRRGRVTGCCMHRLGGVPVATLHLEHEGKPVKLLMGRERDFAPPPGRGMRHRGGRFFIDRRGDTTMLMTRRGGRWLCLVGEMPQEKLIELADHLGDQ